MTTKRRKLIGLVLLAVIGGVIACPPVVYGDQKAVTDLTAGAMKFYRLRKL